MTAHALQQLILAFVQALQNDDVLFLDKYLTADVVYVRTSPSPLVVRGKEDVIARMEPFLRAFSGWTVSAEDIRADAERQQVTCTIHISGRNMGEMDFRAIGQGVYEPTEREFDIPPGQLMLTARGASIRQIDINFPEGGGLVGIFNQIGSHR